MAIAYRYLICLWSFAAVVGFGQALPPPEVTVRFTVFSRQRLAGLCYLPTKHSHPLGLKFFIQNKSELFSYSGPADIAFYAEADWARFAQAKESEATSSALLPRPVAVAALPLGMKEALLLFVPLPEALPTGIQFLVLPVNDDRVLFPLGHVGVINATGRSYMGQVGSKILDIPPGRGGNIAAIGAVDFRLACRDEGQWAAAGHHYFTVGPRTRVCLVLFPASGPTGVGPIIRTLVDEHRNVDVQLATARLPLKK